MYTLLSNLSNESKAAFELLSQNVKFSNNNIRLGSGGLQKLSNYSYSRWYDWTSEQRNTFKQLFHPADANNSVVGWFLTFPAEIGFLDTMTYWQDKLMAGTVVAYALSNNQSIYLNNECITLNKGEGIRFSLRTLHEVKSSTFEQKWACLMQIG